MLIVKQEKGENIERMLKRFKRKFDKTKVLKQLRDRQSFTKKSVRKREMKKKAIYIQTLKNMEVI